MCDIAYEHVRLVRSPGIKEPHVESWRDILPQAFEYGGCWHTLGGSVDNDAAPLLESIDVSVEVFGIGVSLSAFIPTLDVIHPFSTFEFQFR